MKNDTVQVQYKIADAGNQAGRKRAGSVFIIGSESYVECRNLISGVTADVRVFESNKASLDDETEYVVKRFKLGYVHYLERERALFARANQDYKAYSFSYEGNQARLVMSLLPGKTLYLVLNALFKSEKENQLEQMLKIIAAILKAYIKLHTKKVIHLDVKADNIIIEKVHDDYVARVCDFGHSKETGELVTKVGPSTTHWAPELRTYNKKAERIKATEEMDVYSIGAMFSSALINSSESSAALRKVIPKFIYQFIDEAKSEFPEKRPNLKSFYCAHTKIIISSEDVQAAIQNYMTRGRGLFRKYCIFVPAKTSTIVKLEKLAREKKTITESDIHSILEVRDKSPFNSGIIKNSVSFFRDISRELDTNSEQQKLSATEKVLYHIAQSATVSMLSPK